MAVQWWYQNNSIIFIVDVDACHWHFIPYFNDFICAIRQTVLIEKQPIEKLEFVAFLVLLIVIGLFFVKHLLNCLWEKLRQLTPNAIANIRTITDCCPMIDCRIDWNCYAHNCANKVWSLYYERWTLTWERQNHIQLWYDEHWNRASLSCSFLLYGKCASSWPVYFKKR